MLLLCSKPSVAFRKHGAKSKLPIVACKRQDDLPASFLTTLPSPCCHTRQLAVCSSFCICCPLCPDTPPPRYHSFTSIKWAPQRYFPYQSYLKSSPPPPSLPQLPASPKHLWTPDILYHVLIWNKEWKFQEVRKNFFLFFFGCLRNF